MRKGNNKEVREIVVVVVDGNKVCRNRNGVWPLRFALRAMVRDGDEVLVVAVLNSEVPVPSPNLNFCCLGITRSSSSSNNNNNNSNLPISEGDPLAKFLEQEFGQRTGDYIEIFTPFYDKCEIKGVKFQVKIAVTSQPKGVIVEEARNNEATWIVVERSFARDNDIYVGESNCKIRFVSDNDDNQEETSQESATSLAIIESQEEEGILKTLKLDEGSEYLEEPRPPNIFSNDLHLSLSLRMPLKLKGELISKITGGFETFVHANPSMGFTAYRGYLGGHQRSVVVEEFVGDSGGVVELEKKAASAMHHKNILRLIGYHKSENSTFLVFPFPGRGTLGTIMNGLREKDITWEEKMKIAIGIAEGLRYMHEECPRSPIVHGHLNPCSIFIRRDFHPLITYFGKSKWLQHEHSSPISNDRCWHDDRRLDSGTLGFIKSDVHSFGILLLRLFCRKPLPGDNDVLLQWARPLLVKGAYHELMGENNEYEDIYSVFRVMGVAAYCIDSSTTSVSQACMSKVVCVLKGETSCAVQSSPSSEASSNKTFVS